MKFSNKHKFLLLLFLSVSMYAIGQEQEETNPFSALNIIALLNPIFVWAGAWVAAKIKSINSPILLGIIIPGVSALGAWLITLVSPDSNFVTTLLLGLAAVFVNEVMIRLNGSKAKKEVAKTEEIKAQLMLEIKNKG